MKRVAIVVAVAIVLLLVVAVAIPLFFDANQFRPELEAILGRSLGRDVRVGDLKLAIFSGSVTAKDLSIGEDPAFGATPFLRAQTLNAGVDLFPLILSHKLNVTRISVDKPEIDLIQNAGGVWNFSSLGANSPQRPTPNVVPAPARKSQNLTSDLTVAELKISDGRVRFRRLGDKAKPLAMDNLNLEAKNFSESASFPFSLSASIAGGGSVKLNGNAGPIDNGDAVATPFDTKLSVTHLDLLSSGLLDPSTAIAGLAAIDANAKSMGGSLSVQGKLRADQLKLAKGARPATKPVDVDFDLAHSLKTLTGTLRRADVRVGQAVVTITGAYSLRNEPSTLDLKATGSNMPATDLGALLPAFDIGLPTGASIQDGTAQLSLNSQGPADQLVTTGTVSLQNTKLANYDLATKLKVIQALAGIKADPQTTIQTLNATFKNSPAGAAVESLQLAVPSIGEMAGAGTISPAHMLDFKMKVKVYSAAATTASIGFKDGIPFSITGPSDNPSFKPDVKGLATEQLKDLTKGVGPASEIIDGLFGGKKKK
jgi:AsmA protein